MITLNLHGHLAHKFGDSYEFATNSVHETLRAMQANFPEFYIELGKEGRNYHVVVNKDEDFGGDLEKLGHPIGTASTIDIIPAVEGAGGNIIGALAVVAGIALVIFAPAVAAFAATYLGGFVAVSTVTTIGWGLALAGVASLLAPDVPNDGDSKRSSSFNAIDNVVAQGVPVPVGYGRMLCGSVVISAFYASSKTTPVQATNYYQNAVLVNSFAPEEGFSDAQLNADAAAQITYVQYGGQTYTIYVPGTIVL